MTTHSQQDKEVNPDSSVEEEVHNPPWLRYVKGQSAWFYGTRKKSICQQPKLKTLSLLKDNCHKWKVSSTRMAWNSRGVAPCLRVSCSARVTSKPHLHQSAACSLGHMWLSHFSSVLNKDLCSEQPSPSLKFLPREKH
ncbi:unnamed protein product [Leuciscus chuanchicus]